ncbi:E3 ubiquitin/ISG15 ligase TRIM25-like isoform X4 [Dermochelys coriacea]|uniref:E3 ubiquitin/ISG15 ligase TRIM25-like isoform X4 n=1 Tax=Dermochelys coriacea TaxID=27794 RepID=UPI0018E7C1EE|nr:E3 ubiquitin/ISG15 ligase TRIM25-like isoform X4 [Dermochelys coriacea]
MAELVRAPSVPSLAGLEEELTCSICLSLFENPVTTPCGHNFCGPCLDVLWSGLLAGFSCPQCRAGFQRRPELQKNTVLCRVVEQFQSSQPAGPAEAKRGWDESRSEVACDSCLEAAAARTCLTCMASFCLEHLRPHQESPAFRDHALCPPLRDLPRRKCPEHNKLLEFFCREHASCICCVCLVSHRTCLAGPLQEAKAEKESQLKNRLTELYNQSEKASLALDEVRVLQRQTSETAARKMDLLRSEFLEIKALIEEEENKAMKKVEEEEKRVCDKFDYVHNVLGKKKNEIQVIRDQIEMALTEDDDITFLKKAATLPQTSTKNVFIPRIDLDQNLIHTIYQGAFSLKEIVKRTVNQPQEKKMEAGGQSSPSVEEKANPQWKPKAFQINPSNKLSASGRKAMGSRDKRKPAKSAPNTANPGATSLESFLTKSREELLEYAAKITLDFNTAHNKVLLSDRNTKMSVSETPQKYNPHPQRFTYCSQVLGFQCFKRGIHYWEVELQRNNFCGIGICYGSMERQGADSRLGRNSSSWCIEWFNSKISAWHNDLEKCLPNTKATKIGVLLNYEGGFVIFLGVGEKHNLIYKFRAQFTEALCPAFWVFSSGTVLSLCQLK